MDSQSVPTEGGIAFAGFVRFADPALFAAHAFHQRKDRFGRSVMPEAAIDNSATRTGVVSERTDGARRATIWYAQAGRIVRS